MLRCDTADLFSHLLECSHIEYCTIYPLRFMNVDLTSFESTMVTEGKKEEKINKCTKQLLGESIIQFLHELLIHAISHARVSQSQIALLTSFLLPAGRYARWEPSDAACDVPACSGARGTFSSLLPCHSTCPLWPLLDTLVIFFIFFFNFLPCMYLESALYFSVFCAMCHHGSKI